MLTHEDRFLKIQEIEVDNKIVKESPRNFIVYNKKDEILGWINWYIKWKKWVFTSHGSAIFDRSCLLGIVRFIKLHLDN